MSLLYSLVVDIIDNPADIIPYTLLQQFSTLLKQTYTGKSVNIHKTIDNAVELLI